MLVSNFAYALATNLWVLTVARIVCGVGYAACTVGLSTWFSMLVPSNKVGKAMGIYGTMQAISMAIVGKVAITVTDLTNERVAFVISALFAVVTFVLAFVIKDRGNPVVKEGEDKKKIRLLDLNVLPVAIILMLFTIPYNATQGLIKEYVPARGFNVDAGWFITMYAIFLIVLRVGFRNYFDKVKYRTFLFISLISSLVSMTCLHFMNWYILMGVASLCMAGGYGIMCSVTQATAIKLAGGKENRGVANSTYYMGFDMGMALGPTIGGILMAKLPVEMFYPALAVCSLIAFVIYLLFKKKIDNA